MDESKDGAPRTNSTHEPDMPDSGFSRAKWSVRHLWVLGMLDFRQTPNKPNKRVAAKAHEGLRLVLNARCLSGFQVCVKADQAIRMILEAEDPTHCVCRPVRKICCLHRRRAKSLRSGYTFTTSLQARNQELNTRNRKRECDAQTLSEHGVRMLGTKTMFYDRN
jgi:hypothetical protein